VQHVLYVEQITNDNNELIVIALGETFQPLGLFHDKYLKEYKFSTLCTTILDMFTSKNITSGTN
jgi:hypothetical protein